MTRQRPLSDYDYDRGFRMQGGVCAICRLPPSERRQLAVDHEHISGRIRGLLCTRCNTALGLFGDDPDVLRDAIAYLASDRDFEIDLDDFCDDECIEHDLTDTLTDTARRTRRPKVGGSSPL